MSLLSLRKMRLYATLISLTALLLLSACNGNDDPVDPDTPTGRSATYALAPDDVMGIGTGSVRFEEFTNNKTRIVIEIAGTVPGAAHPAHIHGNSLAENGPVEITLGTVNAAGFSEIIVSRKDDGTPITYNELLNYDGYVFVHQSTANLNTIVSSGDIGGNQLSVGSFTRSFSAPVGVVTSLGGTVTVRQRRNGNALVEVVLSGTTTGTTHTVHIHRGDFTGGDDPIEKLLNDVVGSTGSTVTTRTHVEATDATPIAPLTYENLRTGDFYVAVHQGNGSTPKVLIAELE